MMIVHISLKIHHYQWTTSLQSKTPDYDWNFRDVIIDSKVRYLRRRAPSNVFRRAFRIYTNLWKRLMLLIISSGGQISFLLPEPGGDPSRRPEGADIYMDIFALSQTYRVNSEITREILAGMFQSKNYIFIRLL
jgi:hypothetical protein